MLLDNTWIKKYGIMRKGNELFKAVKVENDEEGVYYECGEWVGSMTDINSVGSMAGGTSEGYDAI